VVHRYFVVCLVGVWQRNFEPVVCVYGTAGRGIRLLQNTTKEYGRTRTEKMPFSDASPTTKLEVTLSM
jgi:hypothetical protein